MSELQYGRIPELEKQLAAAADREDRGGETRLLRNRVTDEEVAEVVSKWTGIPVSKMLEGEKEKLLRMEEAIGRRVVGQSEAVAAVANAIRRSRAGLSDPKRPNGSFLFLGPTGVGKTELTKALAAFLFDTEDALVRIDMSEFMEKHSVARLIGAPPGYVGYEEGGFFTEAVRRRPYSVVLLDEVEKAHPDVFNVLLQVLDDGRLTDGHGRTVDFRNTVVVMTSNLGSQRIQAMAGQESYEAMKTAVMEVVGTHFRPEFISRVDDIVVFHPLTAAEIREIVRIQLRYLTARLAERDLGLTVGDEALDLLAEAGFDPVYGARPLKREISSGSNPLASRYCRAISRPATRSPSASRTRARLPARRPTAESGLLSFASFALQPTELPCPSSSTSARPAATFLTYCKKPARAPCGSARVQQAEAEEAPVRAQFHLKGSGWYKTDFRDKGKGGEDGEGKKKAKAGHTLDSGPPHSHDHDHGHSHDHSHGKGGHTHNHGGHTHSHGSGGSHKH